LKGGAHFHACVFTRFAVGDDFRHHRIVERGDFIPRLDTRVDANALTRGLIKEFDVSRAGQEASSGIFSVEPDFDCMPEELNIFLLRWKRLAPCNANLPLNKVVACDHLGHWMLNLQTRIHLQEIELTGLIKQEFHRPRTDVVNGFCGINGSASHCLTKFRRHDRARRFLNHFLVTALNGAIALTEINGIACFICEDLYLDVTWSNHGLLNNQFARTKGVFCL